MNRIRGFYLHMFVLVLLLAMAVPVRAALTVQNVSAVDVTPAGFSVIWQASAGSRPELNVFADSAGLTEITSNFEVTTFPLIGGSPDLTTEYEQDQHQVAFREMLASRGLMKIRVTGLQPAGTYFYKVFSVTATERTGWPAAGLASVTTPQSTTFVGEARQIIVTLLLPDSQGWLVTAKNQANPYGISGIVSDGAAAGKAFLNLANLYTAGGANWQPTGPQDIILTVLKHDGATLAATVSLSFDLPYTVASLTPTDMGGGGSFADNDQDGLPDSWEQLYGLITTDNGSINPDNGPNGDPDEDGYTNLAEYTNGTSPIARTDQDEDGFTPAEGDCDDTNPGVHALASEICNDGIDNNCNDVIDGQTECNPMVCLYDAQCGVGEFCLKPEATCNGNGSCQPLPSGSFKCPAVVDQVCGCDGKVYTNFCEAQRLGVSVAGLGQCATVAYKWPYYFPSVKDNDAIGWENYLSVQAKDPVPMAVTIRVYDMAGNLAGTIIYSDTDPAAKAKAIAPYARVALRPSSIAGAAIEGSMIVETSVPAIASTNCIASFYKGFSIYEAAKVKAVHYFPKAFDGPDNYQVYMVVQNIFPEPRQVTAVLSGKTTSSPGHGANQTTTIPAHGTWKFRPSDIAGGINFDGSVMVYSDLVAARDGIGPPVPAMCRYEAGTEAIAIYESTARQPRLFFPVLKDGKFGTALDYQNYMSVVNMNPQAAPVTVVLYNKSGVEEGRVSDTIPAGGKKTWRPAWIKGSAAVPADFEGLAVILTDQTLIGQTNTIYPGANKYGADGFDLFESAMRNKSLFFPKAYDNLPGSGTGATHLTDNFVYVANPDGSDKSLLIEQFNNNGTLNGTTTVALAPYATHIYRPKNLVTDGSGIFRGSVRVTEQNGLPITGAIKYEVHKTTAPTSGIEALTIYRSMGM